MIADGLREVKEAVSTLSRDMNSQMARLVSQREFDRTRDDFIIDIGELRARYESAMAKHDADVAALRESTGAQVSALRESMDAAEQRRRTERWAVTGAILTILGLLIPIVLHFL